jgi:hypothetical protein
MIYSPWRWPLESKINTGEIKESDYPKRYGYMFKATRFCGGRVI